ncbi:response regulator [Sulfitobacter mediterraneus]|uniref:CheY-like chemotaxis protein n=1 Tax=Sulfitobacter mediterraneus TaxID=83219 RepID=A0A2T6BUC5_9RHOB|nr:response regulator [Sulfitobacter mediterraneus]PTX59567.1 CheY-like chemotaxis protein [Sulfitobacter mediterraneus]
MQHQQNTNKKLLIAEDNPINLLIVTLMLEALGYTIDTAENGVECLNLLIAGSYDLILTDISMPQMDGVQVAKEIRGMSGVKSSIPIIATTANAEPADAEGYMAVGINEVLVKPFSKSDLQCCIDRWI